VEQTQQRQLDARQLKKIDLWFWWIVLTTFYLPAWTASFSLITNFLPVSTQFTSTKLFGFVITLCIFGMLGVLQSQLLYCKLGLQLRLRWTLSWLMAAIVFVVLGQFSQYAFVISCSIAHLLQWLILFKQSKRHYYWPIFASIGLLVSSLIAVPVFVFFWILGGTEAIKLHSVMLIVSTIALCYAVHTAYGLYCSLGYAKSA
jgi:uncharacterized membrane protein YidH (DUF202 family)